MRRATSPEFHAMRSSLDTLTPSITSMIRFDHTHVLALFHRYRESLPSWRKQALVTNACLALDVHAQLEEELFYPALREAHADEAVLAQSEPDHEAIRRMTTSLRALSPDDPAYDETFYALMRAVIHHVADEEAVLLPEAERMLPTRLTELGARMARRRMQLMAPHVGEFATSTAGAFPGVTALLAIGMIAVGIVWFTRSNGSRTDIASSAPRLAREAIRRAQRAMAA